MNERAKPSCDDAEALTMVHELGHALSRLFRPSEHGEIVLRVAYPEGDGPRGICLHEPPDASDAIEGLCLLAGCVTQIVYRQPELAPDLLRLGGRLVEALKRQGFGGDDLVQFGALNLTEGQRHWAATAAVLCAHWWVHSDTIESELSYMLEQDGGQIWAYWIEGLTPVCMTALTRISDLSTVVGMFALPESAVQGLQVVEAFPALNLSAVRMDARKHPYFATALEFAHGNAPQGVISTAHLSDEQQAEFLAQIEAIKSVGR